jgi:membrane protease YdiL (CAAX protease family)
MATQTRDDSRFGRWAERDDGRDFPFYDGQPVTISGARWVLVVLACAVGFAALSTVGSADQWVELVPRVLFLAIPAAVFVWASDGQWRSLFRPVHARDVGAMVVFWLLNLAVSAIAAFAVSGGSLGGLTENSVTDDLGGAGQVVGFYVGTGIQLMGEEVFTILPFLAVMAFLHSRGTSRRTSILVAWLVTAVWFGAAHLPTYDWNLGQAIIVIGAARLVLTLAFIRTKNLWVSFGAHVLNDWVTFTAVLVAASA